MQIAKNDRILYEKKYNIVLSFLFYNHFYFYYLVIKLAPVYIIRLFILDNYNSLVTKLGL